MAWNWHTTRDGRAARDCKRKKILMHRQILNAASVEIVDHINRNPLDNRRSNLRICNSSTSTFNRGPKKGKKYKGVSFDKNRNKYHVQISKDGIFYLNKRFSTEQEAALAYNEVAKELFGEYAFLNDVGHNTSCGINNS